MAARKTGSGRLMLDTGEWEALKEEIVEEVMQGAAPTHVPEIPSKRTSDSNDFIRAIAGEVYTTKQRECYTVGPVGQLTEQMKTVTTHMTEVQSDLRTAREVKAVEDRAFNKRLTLIVGGFTVLGVMGNLINIVWTLVNRGH
jgi:hypothetical protein